MYKSGVTKSMLQNKEIRNCVYVNALVCIGGICVYVCAYVANRDRGSDMVL